MMHIYPVRKTLFPRHVFRISRASRVQVDNLFLAVEQDGVIGYGEASPNSFFREDPFDVYMALAGLTDYFRKQTLRSSDDIARIWGEIWEKVAPSRATQCAIDVGLWDLFAKLSRRTVVDAVHGKPARHIPTSATLGICPREEWPERIAEVAAFPAIKVKMDARVDLDLIKSVRAGSKAAIRVDANCSWSGIDIERVSSQLAGLGVEFIEQPLPREEDNRMPDLLRRSRLPILADESCTGPEEVPGLVGRFTGFNIKLVKCGGITPGLRMVEAGKRLGLKTMIGCMLESGLLISAGAVVAQEADYADLDGSWLLGEDPFEGLSILDGRLQPPSGLGLGVSPKIVYN